MNKESRYKAVNELLKDLIAHQEGLRVMAYRAPYWRRMIKFFKRNPIKTAIVFSGLVALLTFISANYIVYSYYYQPDDASSPPERRLGRIQAGRP